MRGIVFWKDGVVLCECQNLVEISLIHFYTYVDLLYFLTVTVQLTSEFRASVNALSCSLHFVAAKSQLAKTPLRLTLMLNPMTESINSVLTCSIKFAF